MGELYESLQDEIFFSFILMYCRDVGTDFRAYVPYQIPQLHFFFFGHETVL